MINMILLIGFIGLKYVLLTNLTLN